MIRQVFWGLLYTEEDSFPTLFTEYLHIKCLSSPSRLSVWTELLVFFSTDKDSVCGADRIQVHLQTVSKNQGKNKKQVWSEMTSVYPATAKMGSTLVLLFSLWIWNGGRLDWEVKRFPCKSLWLGSCTGDLDQERQKKQISALQKRDFPKLWCASK